MKSNLFPLLLFCPMLSFGQFNFSQYFDGNDTSITSSIIIHFDTTSANVWQVGKPSKNIFNAAATVPKAMLTDTLNPYPVNDTSRFYFGLNPAAFGFGILAMQWKQKLDLDFRHDGGLIEYSRDTGRTWESIFNNPYVYNFYGFDNINQDTLQDGTTVFTGTDSTWKDIWLCFDVSWLSLNDSLLIRFSLLSDSVDNNREGWMVDNMLAHLTWIHTINEFEKDEYMRVFPNPTSGKLDIETRKEIGFHLIEDMQLLNSGGEVVQSWKRVPTKFSINIGDHPPGVYYLKVKTNLHTETFRLILKG